MNPVYKPQFPTTAPTGSGTTTLFSTVTANKGRSALPGSGLKTYFCDIKHDQAGTLKAYWSNDAGTTWYQFYDSGSISAPTYTTRVEVLVEGYRDFKMDWVNGGSNQTTWAGSQCISDERSPAL